MVEAIIEVFLFSISIIITYDSVITSGSLPSVVIFLFE